MKKEGLNKLNKRITAVRVHYGLNKKRFSERLGVSPAYVTDLEAGKRIRMSRILIKLFEYEFQVNSQWLLTGDGPPWTSPLVEKAPLFSGDNLYSFRKSYAPEAERVLFNELAHQLVSLEDQWIRMLGDPSQHKMDQMHFRIYEIIGFILRYEGPAIVEQVVSEIPRVLEERTFQRDDNKKPGNTDMVLKCLMLLNSCFGLGNLPESNEGIDSLKRSLQSGIKSLLLINKNIA